MRILAIETSCDETSVAIVKDGRKILSNVVASSQELHEKTGGIIPEVAAREQVKCIIPMIDVAIKQLSNKAIKQTFKKLNGLIAQLLDSYYIDTIAVTVGPGLIGSLLVGVETAKTIAYVTGKPVIPVNHVFAHIYANWLNSGSDLKVAKGLIPSFPAIALVVSGGHTELFYMEDHRKIKWIGGTLDDAAGECFDKTARLLGLGFPGGPAISAAAEKFPISNFQFPIIKLPRPMIDSNDLNFSFSGLKTAVLREINILKSLKKLNDETIKQLAYEIQESITDVLVKKTLDAAKQLKVKSILLGGGVAANQKLKEKLTVHSSPFSVHIPPPSLCTDNAAYIGSFACFHYKPIPWQKIQAQPDLEVEV